MSHTQEELENKTDHQLNVIVSRLRQLQDKRFYRSYCANWSDCGDLIDELKIDIQHDQVGNGMHFAMDHNGDITSKHKNIKRAVTVVYMLIKQDNNNESI